MTAETVPFGKYKGMPVEDMLADADYMAWLEAQPWFRERFRHLTGKRDADAMSRTPVHNKLQAMFLDPAYCGAFVKAAAEDRLLNSIARARKTVASASLRLARQAERARENAASHRERAAEFRRKHAAGEAVPDWKSRGALELAEEAEKSAAQFAGSAAAIEAQIASQDCAPHRWTVFAKFEAEGADVLLASEITIPHKTASYSGCGMVDDEAREETVFRIEIKPTVADDYPAVLRQMSRNKSTDLFVETYSGDGATEAQFVSMFDASGKKVVFKRDVDALMGRLRRP